MKNLFVRAGVLMCMAAFSLSMAQVDLGGTIVPKDKFIVYLGIGHSNMIGRSSTQTDNVTHPRCWNYKIDQSTPAWILAKPLLHDFGSGGGSGNGPWMPFLKNMAAKYPDYYFGVIENPESGFGMACDFVPGEDGYNELMTPAKKFVGKCTFGGALMMLGLTSCERNSATNAKAFSANAVKMMAQVRTDLQSPNMILMVNEWEACASGDYSASNSNAKLVVAEIAKIPSLIKYSLTINNQGIPCADDHHFQNPGYITFTNRAIDSMLKHKWFPDGAGGATVAVQDNFTGHKNAVELSLDLKQLNKNSLVISFPAAIANPTVNVFDSKGALVAGRGYAIGDKLCYDFPEGQSGCFIVKVTNNGQSYARRFLMVR